MQHSGIRLSEFFFLLFCGTFLIFTTKCLVVAFLCSSVPCHTHFGTWHVE